MVPGYRTYFKQDDDEKSLKHSRLAPFMEVIQRQTYPEGWILYPNRLPSIHSKEFRIVPHP